MSLGVRLRRVREKKGWSQVYVASLMGITSQSLSNYERDERDPDTPTLRKLADIYEVSTDYLFEKTDNSSTHNQDSIVEEWPEIYDVLRQAGRKPTPAERRRLAKIIEAAMEISNDGDK